MKILNFIVSVFVFASILFLNIMFAGLVFMMLKLGAVGWEIYLVTIIIVLINSGMSKSLRYTFNIIFGDE